MRKDIAGIILSLLLLSTTAFTFTSNAYGAKDIRVSGTMGEDGRVSFTIQNTSPNEVFGLLIYIFGGYAYDWNLPEGWTGYELNLDDLDLSPTAKNIPNPIAVYTQTAPVVQNTLGGFSFSVECPENWIKFKWEAGDQNGILIGKKGAFKVKNTIPTTEPC